MDFLTRKKIAETRTSSGSKKYTVKELRRLVREQVKEANRILIDTEGGKKSPYIKQIAQDIAQYNLSSNKSGEYLTQSKVKYMTSSQLMSAYNALEGLKAADMESVEYAKRLAGKYNRMRYKWSKKIGKNISEGAFDEMMELFTEYGDKVIQYKYQVLLDQVKEQRRHKRPKLIDEILRVEKEHPGLGPEGVLKYIQNEVAIENLLKQGMTLKDAMDEVGKQ